MSESDISPSSYRLKPLTKAQLRKRQKELENASKKIEEIQALERKNREKAYDPNWV